ncbi:MAG TPA: FRG domain-containing protein [Longimicrobiales bacterium]|nr:FRG domain-containing protein [Longimicrobiales bacterium]
MTEPAFAATTESDVARSWAELDELLFLDAWDPGLRRIRVARAFRGMSTREANLRSRLLRLGGDAGAKERHLIRNFRKYARRNVVRDDSIWSWLALGQHHHLPTRLLDWTYSPYVALHFATAIADEMNVDGEVWTLDLRRIKAELPTRYRELLESEGSFVFTGELLSQAAKGPAELRAASDEPFLLFLEPPTVSDRIENQAALFSMLSHVEAPFEGWLARRPDAWRRVIVPASLKWEVRDRLDQIGMTERLLFPGLDGLSAWLSRYYSER